MHFFIVKVVKIQKYFFLEYLSWEEEKEKCRRKIGTSWKENEIYSRFLGKYCRYIIITGAYTGIGPGEGGWAPPSYSYDFENIRFLDHIKRTVSVNSSDPPCNDANVYNF